MRVHRENWEVYVASVVMVAALSNKMVDLYAQVVELKTVGAARGEDDEDVEDGDDEAACCWRNFGSRSEVEDRWILRGGGKSSTSIWASVSRYSMTP